MCFFLFQGVRFVLCVNIIECARSREGVGIRSPDPLLFLKKPQHVYNKITKKKPLKSLPHPANTVFTTTLTPFSMKKVKRPCAATAQNMNTHQNIF